MMAVSYILGYVILLSVNTDGSQGCVILWVLTLMAISYIP